MKYSGENLKEIVFPLGGIGTGSIGLSGDGRLKDWEIFNKPAKGSENGHSHFAIRAIKGDKITAAVINGDYMASPMGTYSKARFSGYGFGPNCGTMCGFPHFKDVEFNGEFPVASVSFKEEHFPANVNMLAFNPFIPLDEKNSSIPAAFFEIEIENTTTEEIKYQVALSVKNPYAKTLNKAINKGVFMYSAEAEKDSTEYGDLTIATDAETAQTQAYWLRGYSLDEITMFWHEFTTEKTLKDREYTEPGTKDTATVMAEADVLPGEKKKVRFVIAWNMPNNYNYWAVTDDESVRKPWKNYYATVFEDSSKTAEYALKNWDSLYERTLLFKNALHASTLPEEVIDAASANLAVLKSPTVLRLSDGSFYAWEGVHEESGSCEGTCQHVWNYAYAMCFLFPRLERSVRDMEFKYSSNENGRMGFRIMLPLGRKMTDFRACVDGQMGAVIKTYREWKISGDNEWLKSKWNDIKKVLEYAWSEHNPDRWDRDRDGVMEGRQHHTLDQELFGPSSWMQGFYLAALKAAAEMGEFLGDTKKAKEYLDLFEKGYKWTKENLFNGKYFIQKVDITDKAMVDSYEQSEHYWVEEIGQMRYQIDEGSAIDQMLAQWHADILGLGQIYDEEQILKALSFMMQENYKESMRYHENRWRIYALNDEGGTLICAYPKGVKRPLVPVEYCDEVMTGMEYAFAGLLFSQGKFSDGLKVTKTVRQRFNGKNRNPWNEFECGSNYARSMASYSFIPILSGFEFDMPQKHIGFNPYKTDEFKCIWSLADAWGTFEILGNTIKVNILEGAITLESLGLKFCDGISSLKIDGNKTDFNFKNGKIQFNQSKISKCMEIKR